MLLFNLIITSDIDEIRWSKWLESMHKDVKCTFGILKGTWCILKSGIQLQGVEQVNNIWLTCCALHNWSLEIDELNAEWSEVSMPVSNWEGKLGATNLEGIRHETVPWLLMRLSQHLDPRTLDLSGVGPGNDVVCEQHIQPDENDNTNDDGVDSVWRVKNNLLKMFRR